MKALAALISLFLLNLLSSHTAFAGEKEAAPKPTPAIVKKKGTGQGGAKATPVQGKEEPRPSEKKKGRL